MVVGMDVDDNMLLAYDYLPRKLADQSMPK